MNAVPELREDFQFPEMPDEVYVEVGSDWAQCPRTTDVDQRWPGVLGQALAAQLLSATAHDAAQQR